MEVILENTQAITGGSAVASIILLVHNCFIQISPTCFLRSKPGTMPFLALPRLQPSFESLTCCPVPASTQSSPTFSRGFREDYFAISNLPFRTVYDDKESNRSDSHNGPSGNKRSRCVPGQVFKIPRSHRGLLPDSVHTLADCCRLGRLRVPPIAGERKSRSDRDQISRGSL